MPGPMAAHWCRTAAPIRPGNHRPRLALRWLSRRGKSFFTIALLPAAFALEAACSSAVAIATDQSIEIAAPPSNSLSAY